MPATPGAGSKSKRPDTRKACLKIVEAWILPLQQDRLHADASPWIADRGASALFGAEARCGSAIDGFSAGRLIRHAISVIGFFLTTECDGRTYCNYADRCNHCFDVHYYLFVCFVFFAISPNANGVANSATPNTQTQIRRFRSY